MKDAIKHLIMSFDDDEGLPEATYDATYNIIQIMFGQKAASTFSRYVDSTGGRFYVKRGAMPELLADIQSLLF